MIKKILPLIIAGAVLGSHAGYCFRDDVATLSYAPSSGDIGMVVRNIPSGTQDVTGTFYPATQPVSGTVTANAGSGTFVVGDGAGALNTIIDSGSVSITGTPTVAISQTTTNNDVDANITNATLAVTQSGTWAVTQATATSLRAQVFGDDTTQALDVDALGQLQVDVLTMPTTTVTATNLDVQIGGSDTVTVTATNLDVQIGGSDSLTIGAFPDNEPFNVAQINGVAPSMGNGISGTGVQRVTIASDSTGQVAISGTPTVTVGTFPDNEPFNIAQMNGVAVSMGVGNTGTGTQRVVTATGGTATASQVADTATSTTILAANTSRRSSSVTNDSSAVLYLLVGAGTASATNYTFRLAQYGAAIIDSTSAQLAGVWATDPNDGGAKVTEIA